MRLWMTATFCCICMSLSAQKEEIRAFEKQNKPVLKMLKKEYSARPVVQMTEDGIFYIRLVKNINGAERFYLADETGALIYPELLDYCKPTVSGGYFFIGVNDEAGQALWGAIKNTGTVVFPLKYKGGGLSYCPAYAAGSYTYMNSTYWRPASAECWVATEAGNDGVMHNTFYAADGKTVLNQHVGTLSPFMYYFWTVRSGKAESNTAGLLTVDGKSIFPQEYNHFVLQSSGLVKCAKREPDGLLLYGGKMLDSRISDVKVPPMFNSLIYSDTQKVIMCRMHRGDDFEPYNPAAMYEISHRDKGERLFDQGKYGDVIAYYEGEGYGSKLGNYYMGLASREIGQTEMWKMDRCIATLKSSTQYYLPVKNPEKYQFDAGTITTMYISAGTYLEKFINDNNIPDDDPYKIKARKLRGEIVTVRNGITKKVSEYGDALAAASRKNVEREAAIAAQQAQQQATANSIANGLTNILLGGMKK